MTGFGRAEAEAEGRAFAVEVKSVNGRQRDVALRLPWADAEMEARARSAVLARVARGRIDLAVREQAREALPRVDEREARALKDALDAVAGHLGTREPVALFAALLAHPSLVSLPPRAPDVEAIWAAIGPAIERALDGLDAMRGREGETLGADLRARCDAVSRLVEAMRGQAEGVAAVLAEALRERVRALLGDAVDAQRVAQEAALLADRADVTEELVRLGSHLGELRRTLQAGGAVGRKLDFLLQEVHRELTTIGSKSRAAALTALVVEAKTEVDRMREQAANLE